MDFFQQLTAARNFYYGIYNYNNEINSAKQVVKEIDNECNVAIQRVGKKAWPGVVLIIIGCIIMFGVFLLASQVAQAMYLPEFMSFIFLFASFVSYASILPLAFGYKFLICNRITKKKRKVAKEKWYQDNNERYEQAKECVASLELEKQRHIEENECVLDAFPETYRDETSIVYMYVCVRDKRADTLKEAINLYEEQKHRWTIEQQNENIRDELWWMRFEQEQANAETQEQLRKIGRDVDMAATYTIFFNN